jgi:hypothetical protein
MYPSIQLPDYFITVLKSNMAQRSNFIVELTNYIRHYPSMLGLIRKYFKDVDEQIRLDIILKSMGWENFRNRLAIIFINFEKYHFYPDDLDQSFLPELVTLENKVKAFTTSDNSRAFLLSFYKTIASIKLSPQTKVSAIKVPEISQSTIGLLRYANSKLLKVDLVLLILEQLSSLVGERVLNKNLEEKFPFSAIYNLMDEKMKEDFVINLLNYGQSIKEVDLFIKDTI